MEPREKMRAVTKHLSNSYTYKVSDTPHTIAQVAKAKGDLFEELIFRKLPYSGDLHEIFRQITAHAPSVRCIHIFEPNEMSLWACLEAIMKEFPPSVRGLQLGDFRLDAYDHNPLIRLFAALPLEKLMFNRCDTSIIEDYFVHLCQATTVTPQASTLKHLTLNSIGMTDRLAGPLMKFVHGLQTLDMSGIKFATTGVIREWNTFRYELSKSKTIEKLRFSGDYGRLIPTHLPTNLRSLECTPGWGESSRALSELVRTIQAPTMLRDLRIRLLKNTSGISTAFKLVPMEVLRGLRTLHIAFSDGGKGIEYRIADIFSEPNSLSSLHLPETRIESAMMHRIVMSKHFNVANLWINWAPAVDHHERELLIYIRGQTRLRYLTVSKDRKTTFDLGMLCSGWFTTLQAILSARYIPRLSAPASSSEIPWGDHARTIAATLGWPIDELYIQEVFGMRRS